MARSEADDEADAPAPRSPRQALAWDAVVRLFHWTVVAGCFLDLFILDDGKRGRFFNTVELVTRLESEARGGRQGRFADYLTRMDFIILDELGYLPFAQSGGQLLKTLASPRRKGRRVHVPQIGGERFVDRAAALSALASVWNVSTMR
jgi:hypothetical protein